MLLSSGGSPGGTWWSASSLVQRPEQLGGSTGEHGIEQFADPVDLRRRLVHAAVLEHVHTRGRCSTTTRSVPVTSTKNTSWRSATRSHDGLYALGSMAVPNASTASTAVGCRASARGSSPRERFAASGPSRSGRLVSPATTPASLVASHVPPPTSSRPPRIAGPPSAPSRRVIGMVGRARRWSRLAATISGIPGTTPLTTINRHITGSVRAGRQRSGGDRAAARRGRRTAAADHHQTPGEADRERDARCRRHPLESDTVGQPSLDEGAERVQRAEDEGVDGEPRPRMSSLAACWLSPANVVKDTP